MRQPARRVLFLASAILILALMSAPGSPAGIQLASAQGAETFTRAIPAKVYSGIPSHAALADADPTNGTTGYCVDVANEGHFSTGPDVGFQVVNGVTLSTSYFANGSATTLDDVYCVVAQADRIASETLPRPAMEISWAFVSGTAVEYARLSVVVVTVELRGIDGVVRGIAQVCTFGWDPTFLTGEFSNTPPLLPNPLDSVSPDDWTPDPLTVDVAGVTKRETEWCANLSSAAPVASVGITFKFWAAYAVASTVDDILITESALDIVSIKTATFAELRHVTPLDGLGEGGQLDNAFQANPNVVGAIHAACIVPSDVQDTLDPGDINFFSGDGAVASHVSVFHNDETLDYPGVSDGTLCFTWTSQSPGSQTISLSYTAGPGGPTNPSGSPISAFAAWDTDGDGNGLKIDERGQLSKSWAKIDHTRLTSGGDFTQNIITFQDVSFPVGFNAADGRFLGKVSVTEWVLGHVPANGPLVALDGVPVTLSVTTQCGYFETDSGPSKTVQAITTGGRIEVSILVDFDGGCGPSATITMTARAMYPSIVGHFGVVELESVTFHLSYTVPQFAPSIYWLGANATLTFEFSGDCPTTTSQWVREAGQPGAFVPGPGVQTHGADNAVSAFEECASAVRYESEAPGEVDITAHITGNPFSKVHYTLYYIALEDIVLTTAEEQTVSEFGKLEAKVRGWFLGDNPSGRPEEVKADGRVLPADRWILPDDWDKLRGPSDNRRWPAVKLPPIRVTFFMKDEGIRNSYKSGVKHGAAGSFLADADGLEVDFNVNPESGVSSLLGSVDAPRLLSEWSDSLSATGPSDGKAIADVLTWGDFNLSYEGCAINAPTGSVHCKVGDIVGRTTYFAQVDYPVNPKGKFPPLRSNTVDKRFTWQGYKQVTVEEGAVVHEKYVVVHLKDRDGFCDALSINNVLGTAPIEFKVDNGEGIIIEAKDNPSSTDATERRRATATTFDTEDDRGRPINQAITQPTIIDDECQAWIRVSDSLMRPMNVLVRIPGPATVVPRVRVTALACGVPGKVVLTNVGASQVSLAGFSLRKPKAGSAAAGAPGVQVSDEEIVGLVGHLQPGESTVVTGEAAVFPWFHPRGLPTSVITGYVRLVWEEENISYFECGSGAVIRTIPGTEEQFPFPGPNVPTVRITGLACGLTGRVTLTNVGATPVSLTGLSLRKLHDSAGDVQPVPANSGNEDNLALSGDLDPGQTRDFTGDFTKDPWFHPNVVRVKGIEGHVRLLWRNAEVISAFGCTETVFAAGGQVQYPFPAPKVDLEGELLLDILVTFSKTMSVTVNPGWNLVASGTGTLTVAEALGGNEGKIAGIWGYDATRDTYEQFIPGGAAELQTLMQVGDGRVYWVLAKERFTLLVPK